MGRREEKEEKDITEPIQKSGKKPFQEHEVYDVAQPFADEWDREEEMIMKRSLLCTEVTIFMFHLLTELGQVWALFSKHWLETTWKPLLQWELQDKLI